MNIKFFIRSILSILVILFFFSASNSFSLELKPSSPTSFHLNEDPKSLHEIMMHMDTLWLPIGRSIIRKNLNDETLEMIDKFQKLTYQAIFLVPSKIESLPSDEKRAAKLKYSSMMSELLKLSFDLEVFYTKENYNDAVRIYREMNTLKLKGHEYFSDSTSLFHVHQYQHSIIISPDTRSSPWNTKSSAIYAKVGETLRIYNNDSVPHQLHTNGAPCPHGRRILPGAYEDCSLRRPYNPDIQGPLYDHIYGRNAEFWIYVSE